MRVFAYLSVTGSALAYFQTSSATMRRQALTLVRSALRAGESASAANSTTAAASFAIRRGFADDANLMKTTLYDFHVENGGTSKDAAIAAKTPEIF